MHSKKLFVSAQLKRASFWSASSVHGYARVHTSIYIYIYIYVYAYSYSYYYCYYYYYDYLLL